MEIYKLKHSHKKTKKYDLITPDKKTISFGAKDKNGNFMSDYTIHKDPARK